MNKKELDNLREIHMEFASLAQTTTTMNSNSITDFFGWLYKQLGARSDAEMTGFRKGREYAKKEVVTEPNYRHYCGERGDECTIHGRFGFEAGREVGNQTTNSTAKVRMRGLPTDTLI